FSEGNGSVEIFHVGEPVIGDELEYIRFRNFLEAAPEVACFVFEQALAHFRGFFALLLVDPVADFAFRRGGFDEAEPIAAWVMPFLREDFDDGAARNIIAPGNPLPI